MYVFLDFYVHNLLFLVLAMLSILLAFVGNHLPSRNPRTQRTLLCCICSTFFKVGLWQGCDLA